jgi:anion-transporting  ArsA/GET3 family ATPase
VITIDPAKRLADALGVRLGGEPARVPLAGVEGSLDGLMLDVKATFDELIAEHARTREQREAILRNRIYRSLSGSVAGAQEYMAMERLHQLVGTGRYDRVVLDTGDSAALTAATAAECFALSDAEALVWAVGVGRLPPFR